MTDDRAMLAARAIVEAHILIYGYVPNPDKIKEAIAKAIRDASANTSGDRGGK
jgi:hypothetical protein